MDQMKRFAIYYAPAEAAFAAAAAQWLGWDLARGCAVDQPDILGLQADTSEPRKYGFHGTIKPPFRLAPGTDLNGLTQAVAQLAAGLAPVRMLDLQLINLHGFLALMPQGDATGLQGLAADVVRGLDAFRAPLTEAERARRQPDRLTPRQRALLDLYGYPFVLEEFQFHLTLSGNLTADRAAVLAIHARRHFADVMPRPFILSDLCLCGEDQQGRFHLLHRYPLMA